MNLEELKTLGEPVQAENFPHIWSVRHRDEQKATVLDTLSGEHVVISTEDRAEAMAELESFLSRFGPTENARKMHEMSKQRDVERATQKSDDADEQADLELEAYDDAFEDDDDDEEDTDPYLDALFEDDELNEDEP